MGTWVYRLCLWVLLASETNAASVRLFNGQTYEGKVEINGMAMTVAPQGGASVTVDPTTVLDITFRRNPLPSDSLPAGIVLVNGSVVADPAPPPIEGAAVIVGAEKFSIPTQAVACVLFTPIPEAKVFGVTPGQTGALLATGDFFPGTFLGIKDKKVSINSILFGPQKLDIKLRATGIILRDFKIFAARYEVVSTHGSTFRTDDLQLGTAELVLRDSILGPVHIKVPELAAIRAPNGRYQFLADQKPFRVDAPAGMDPGVALHVRKDEKDPGANSGAPTLITAANAAVSYSVPAGFTTFACGVALPKDTPVGVRFAFSVSGDGRPLFRSTFYGASDKPSAIRVDIRQSRFITLRVEPAGLASGTSGEWISPVLLR